MPEHKIGGLTYNAHDTMHILEEIFTHFLSHSQPAKNNNEQYHIILYGYTIRVCGSVTTAWCVLRLRMENGL